MLNDGVWPIWVVTAGVVLPLFAVMVACVCCRRAEPKNELLGLAGMVKITNPEERVNHNQQQNEISFGPVNENTHSVADVGNPSKRASTTANRSLPDIPVERLPVDNAAIVWEGSEPNGDTSSELYATVEENKNVTETLVTRRSNSRIAQKRTTLERAGSDSKDNVQEDNGYSPYSEHPYDKLKSEHPYAQVGASNDVQAGAYISEGFADLPSSQNEESSVVHTNTSVSPRSPLSHLAIPGNPVPPPRARRSSSHNSLVLAVPDIQAATAIAGHISANQELPYMTPPITVPEVAMSQQIQQPNFSGDSQDSKGYTSISVREPLANIKAQTKVTSQRSRTQELVDSHYATVSDDSDEMYAAIDEPGQLYNNGSETYAQIQPLAVMDPGLKVPETTGESGHYPPQPPSVDSLKHVAQVHSRQASSSSAASSVANLGSPKPEKRQANSPLPLPPAGSPELYAAVDKKGTMGLIVNRNLEEMYAKVMKKKKQCAAGSNGKTVEETERGSSSSVLDVADSLSHHSINSVETVSSQDSPDLQTQQDMDGISACSSEHDSILGFGPVITRSDPTFGCIASHYEISMDNTEPSYESLGGPSSINTSYHDPGYEVVQHHSLDGDPNYEELQPKPSNIKTKTKGEVLSEIPSKSTIVHKQNVSMEKAKFEETISKTVRTTNKGAVLGMSELGYEQVKYRGLEYEAVRLGVVEPDYASVNRNGNKGLININKSQANGSSASVTRNVDECVQLNEADYYGMVMSNTEQRYVEIGASSHLLYPGYEQVGENSDKHDGSNTSNNLRQDSPGCDGYDRVEPPRAEPDYAVVDRHHKLPLEYADESGEPNYESMSSEGQDSSYALVSRTTADPNYESVNYFNEFDLPCDPPYERLNNETRDSDDVSSGYEKVKDHVLDEARDTVTYAEPNYEEVGTKWDTMNGNAETMPSSLQDRVQKDQSNFNVYRQQEESNQTRM